MTNIEPGAFGKSLDVPHWTELSIPKYRVEELELSYLQKIRTARLKNVFSLIYLKFVSMGEGADLE